MSTLQIDGLLAPTESQRRYTEHLTRHMDPRAREALLTMLEFLDPIARTALLELLADLAGVAAFVDGRRRRAA